jgi:hypothetical protein
MISWSKAYDEFGHKYWTAMMVGCKANVTKMARVSGSNRQDVYKKLKRFKVKLPVTARHCGGHRGRWGTLTN